MNPEFMFARYKIEFGREKKNSYYHVISELIRFIIKIQHFDVNNALIIASLKNHHHVCRNSVF